MRKGMGRSHEKGNHGRHKSQMKNKKIYNTKYYEDRDHLDLHLAETIKLFMDDFKLEKLLDVGCGTGRIVKFFNDNGFKSLGCDIYEDALTFARKINKKNTIVKASAVKLPFKKNAFDIVISISVIEHLTPNEAEVFIQESERVLKPGGFIFLVTPNYATPIRLLQGKKWFAYFDPTHINFYTPKSLSALLKSSGFIHTKTRFKTAYGPTFDWEFPHHFGKLPPIAKRFFVYLLFSSPLSIIRNSFWIAAQKQFKT
jgi:2-polyprenyl-3-methyl-5-hydroxy-6-metoxy-1,4-benzoquinol methylase